MRAVLEALHEDDMPTPEGFMEDRPEVLSWAEDLYVGYYECDRDLNGNLLFSGMNAVLDELGVTDRWERQTVRTLWRQMEAERSKRAKELKGG